MTKAYFSEIEKIILANLQKATGEIKVAVAWITNRRLFDVLIAQRNAGKSVEIIIADDRMNFSNPNINFQHFIDLGGIVRVSRYPQLMHHKFCVLDNRLLITGSYNWTRNAELNNLENIIVCTELLLVKQFMQAFDTLKTVTEQVNSVAAIPMHNYTTEQERQSEWEYAITTQPISDAVAVASDPETATIEPEIIDMFNKAELLYLQAKYEPALKIAEKILETRKDLPAVYELVAVIKWRQGKFMEQVAYAMQAVDIDNQFYNGYNTLGIGYANLRNAQKSIENYQICLDLEPDDYVVFKNRASSYIDLETDCGTPAKLRHQFKQKADEDLKRAIELTNKYESERPNDYRLYFIRGAAKYMLGKYLAAKPDLLKGVTLYYESPEGYQDIHDLQEMKAALKDIERMQKSG